MSISSEECISIQPCSKVHGLSGRMGVREYQDLGQGPDACFAAKQIYKAPSPRKHTFYPTCLEFTSWGRV